MTAENITNRPSDTNLSPEPLQEDKSFDPGIRPKTLSEYIGQQEVKTSLDVFITAARKRGEALDHVLIHGQPGLGKTTLAHIIATELGVNVQIGGGIRSEDDVQYYLENGVARVIIGSLAIQQPEFAVSLIEKFGADKIVIGLDAKDGMVATHGWLETSSKSAIEVGQYFASNGAKTFIFTDIATDGTLNGPNILANELLAEATGAEVIVSGGISSLSDVKQVAQAATETKIGGVIIGKALYENRFTLPEALREVASC